MEKITREELKKLINSGEEFMLVNSLNKQNFEERYIPNSLNISINTEGFDEKLLELIPDKTKKIIVYCSHFECPTSEKAIKRMVELGYTKVTDYAGGMDDWIEAGYPVVGTLFPKG